MKRCSLFVPQESIDRSGEKPELHDDADTNQHHLLVTNAAGVAEMDQMLSAQDICGGKQCAVFSPELSPGPHTWQVQAINPNGAGPWSKKLSFTVRQ